jgi:hypothetical protein
MNKEKLINLLEIIAVIVIIVLVVGNFIYKNYFAKMGTSSNSIDTSTYQGLIEVDLSSNPKFMLVINKSNKVSNIIFLNSRALVLKDKGIENNTMDKAINMIVEILSTKKYLDNSNITLVNYGYDDIYNNIKTLINKNLVIYGANSAIIDSNNILSLRVKELNINATDISDILTQLNYYSKVIILNGNKNTSIVNSSSDKAKVLAYTKTVYTTLSKYAITVEKQDKESSNLLISTIPGDSDNSYYPNSNSYYYIDNYIVYAYIEFSINNNNYGYCYNGSINNYKEGKC